MSTYPRREFLRKVGIAGAGFLLARWSISGDAWARERLSLAYGDRPLAIDSPEGLLEVLTANPYAALANPASSILNSLAHPVGSAALKDRIKPGVKIAIAISDQTRQFPQREMIEQLLVYLYDETSVQPEDITFVVGNGNHAVDPLHVLGLGDPIVGSHRFINFDSKRYKDMKKLGHTDPLDPKFFTQAASRSWTRGVMHAGGSVLSGVRSLMYFDADGFTRALHGGPVLETGMAALAAGGTDVWVDKHVAEADLVIGLGQIKPHPLTGYSGGVKAVAPGVMGRKAIIANHLLQAHPSVGLGKVDDNILRLDLEKACSFLPNVFLLNVVMNGDREPAAYVAGDPVGAHRAGVEISAKISRVKTQKADIVIYSNKTQGRMNLYQFIKSLAIGKAIVKPGGVIIAVGDLPDGKGSRMQISPVLAVREVYYHYNYSYRMPSDVDVFLVCSNSREVARGTFFAPFPSVEKAIAAAKSKIGRNATISVIPETDMILPV